MQSVRGQSAAALQSDTVRQVEMPYTAAQGESKHTLGFIGNAYAVVREASAC